MTEKEGSLKLTVVKSTEDKYLVGHYYKVQLDEVEGLVGVIRAMGNFDTNTLKSEPTYYDLSPETQELIDTVRQVLVERDEALLENWSRTERNVHNRLTLRFKMSDEEIERKLKE